MKKKIALVFTSTVVSVFASEQNPALPLYKKEILSIANGRNYQEDFSCIKELDEGLWCAVYDGHGGTFAARFLQQNLHTYFEECKNSDIRERMIQSFKKCEEDMIAHFQREDKTDEMSCQGYCGSTAVVAFVKEKEVHFAHVGDSRAILIRDKKIVFATTDHKVNNPNELIRMQQDGAKDYITGLEETLKSKVKIPRVEGLAVSRAFGDYALKNKLKAKCTSSVVIAEPEYTCVSLEQKDKLILASDGLWDVMSNEDVLQIIEEKKESEIQNVTYFLVHTAMKKGSEDNITIIRVDLLS